MGQQNISALSNKLNSEYLNGYEKVNISNFSHFLLSSWLKPFLTFSSWMDRDHFKGKSIRLFGRTNWKPKETMNKNEKRNRKCFFFVEVTSDKLFIFKNSPEFLQNLESRDELETFPNRIIDLITQNVQWIVEGEVKSETNKTNRDVLEPFLSHLVLFLRNQNCRILLDSFDHLCNFTNSWCSH